MHFLYQAHIVKQHEPKTSEKSLYQKKLYALHGLAREGVRHSLVKYEGGDDTKDGFGPFWSKTAYGLICNEFDQKSTLHWPKTGRKAVAKFERIGEGAFVS